MKIIGMDVTIEWFLGYEATLFYCIGHTASSDTVFVEFRGKWMSADDSCNYVPYFIYESVSKSFRTDSITKYTLATINTCWEATKRVMAANLIRVTHKIAIQLHLVAESSIIWSSRSRQPVRKLLDTPSYIPLDTWIRVRIFMCCALGWPNPQSKESYQSVWLDSYVQKLILNRNKAERLIRETNNDLIHIPSWSSWNTLSEISRKNKHICSVKSGERGGHAIASTEPIHWPRKWTFINYGNFNGVF
jgi:hypothetical protein